MITRTITELISVNGSLCKYPTVSLFGLILEYLLVLSMYGIPSCLGNIKKPIDKRKGGRRRLNRGKLHELPHASIEKSWTIRHAWSGYNYSCIFFPQGVFTSLNVTGAIAKAIIVIQNFGLRGVSSCSSLSTRQPYGVQRSQGGSTVPCLLL